MTTVLVSLIGFIVAIGVLVTIHEFGHFWVARRVGVKVLRFSVGFGRPLLLRRFGTDQTEFVIAALPLGGYVRMLDEREGDVPAHDVERAFNRQSLGGRVAIVLAGPAANFLFAIVAYAVVGMIGIPGVVPVVAAPAAGSIAEAAQFAEGDRIVAVDERRVKHWQDANIALLDAAVAGRVAEVRVLDRGNVEQIRRLDMSDRRRVLAEGSFIDNLGLQPGMPPIPPVVGEVIRDGAAARADLRAGDRIERVAGRSLSTWSEWVAVVRDAPERELMVDIERDGQRLTLAVTPDAVPSAGETIGQIGARVEVDPEWARQWRVVERMAPWTAVAYGVQQTFEVTSLTLRVLARMLTGEASARNISGPVTIADYAGTSVLLGVATFVGFLALISVSLGIVNLLPIPTLDGGHLLFYLIEWMRGSAVSERVQLVGQQIGLAIIAGLMVLALYNDIWRLTSSG